jgi:hypothetical protein
VSSALSIYAEWVYAESPEKCRTSPKAYKAGIARNASNERRDDLALHRKWHPEATAADIARDVLGVPGIGDPTPPARPPEPEWHFDPNCHEHASDGMVTVYVGAAGYPERCACARPEPYPDADVIQLHRREPA